MKRSFLLALTFTCFFAPSFSFAAVPIQSCTADTTAVFATCNLTAVGANHLIVVTGISNNVVEPTTVTDTFGNTIVAVASGTENCGASSGNSCRDNVAIISSVFPSWDAWIVYWNTGSHSGAETITVTLGGSGHIRFAAFEYAPDANVSAWTIDQTAAGCTTCANSGTIGTGVTLAIPTAGELLFVAGYNVDTATAGSGYTLELSSPFPVEDRVVSAAGTYNAAMAVGGATSNPNLLFVTFTPCPGCIAMPPPSDGNGYVRGVVNFDQTVPPPPVSTPLTITTVSPLPAGAQNGTYNVQLAATGGVSPYTWDITSGTLPTGLTLGTGGDISGTATGTGTSTFTVQATDAVFATKTKSLSLTVNAGPSSHSVSLTWNSSALASTYNVWRGTFNNGPYTKKATGVLCCSYVDAAVSSGITYFYVVSGVADTGEESGYSNQASAPIP